MNFDTFDTLDVNSRITPACNLYSVIPDFTSNVSNVSHSGENISPPLAAPDGITVYDTQSADGDRADDRAGQIVASRRWRRSAIGNPTLVYRGRRVVVVRDVETGVYGYTLDRRWARGRWAIEGEAKRAAAVALLALPRKPRHRPARTDRLVETRWVVARAAIEGQDDDDRDDVYDDDEQSERNFA